MFSNLQTQTRNCRCTNNCFRFWILSSLKYWIADDGLPIWVSKLLHIPMHLMWQFNPSVTEDWKEKERCESNLNSPQRRFVSKMLCQLFQEVFKPPLSPHPPLSLSLSLSPVRFSGSLFHGTSLLGGYNFSRAFSKWCPLKLAFWAIYQPSQLWRKNRTRRIVYLLHGKGQIGAPPLLFAQ